MSIKSFTQLDSYKECRLLRKDITEFVKNVFPPDEKFRLTDQIIRSSRSVTACIAEGYGRFHFKENVRFCRMARGSLEETLEHLITAYDEGYVTAEQLKSFKTQIDNCSRLLNGYISYLVKQK
jgi:four helix bundle protein